MTQPFAPNQPAPLSDSILSALNAAPTLQNQPGTAIGVAQAAGGDPNQAAQLGQTAGQAGQVNAFGDAVGAVERHSTVASHVFGWLGSAIHVVTNNPVTGTLGGKILSYMAKPLQEVQHEYRYLHAVYSQHGVWDGLLQTGAVLVGAVAGGFVGGPMGAVLGAELVGEVEGRASQAFGGKNSLWNETATGGKLSHVSFGRDVASLVPWVRDHPNSEAFSLTSGLIDGAADWFADPLVVAGSISRDARETTYALKSADHLSGMTADNAPRAFGNFAGKQFTGDGKLATSGNATRQTLTNAVQRVVPGTSPVWRAFQDQAQETSTSALMSRYRGISADTAADLAKAKTTEQVLKVWQTAAATEDHLSTRLLPTLTITSLGAARARMAFLTAWRKQTDIGTGIDEASGLPTVGLTQDVTASWRDRLTAYRAYVVDDKNSIKTREVDPAHPNFLKVIRDQALITQNRAVANKLVDYAAQFNVAGRIAIYRQVVKNNVLAMIPDDTAMQQQILSDIDAHLIHDEGVLHGEFGHDLEGASVDVTHIHPPNSEQLSGDGLATDAFDKTVKAAVWSTQRGKVRVPDYMSLVDAARSAGHLSQFYGKLDSFAYHYITAAFFKPLALLTPAFAMRVGLSEALLNAFREGPRQYFGGLFAQRAATLRTKLMTDEFKAWQGIGSLARVGGLFGGVPLGTIGREDMALMARNVLDARADLYSKISRGLAKSHFGESETWFDSAARLAADNHRITEPAIDAAHSADPAHEMDLPGGLAQSLMKGAGKAKKTRTILSDTWRPFGPNEANHDALWTGALNLRSRAPEAQVAAKNIRLALARNHSFTAVERDAIKRQARYLASPEGSKATQTMMLAKGDPYDLATRQVKDLIAKTFSPETRTVHADLLSKMEAGGKFTKEDVADITEEHRPVYVEGAEVLANPQSGWSTLVNKGFNKMVTPIIQNLSRKGIYVTKVDEQYRALKAYDEASGLHIPDDELWARAKTRAIEDMLPDIHNVYLRSQFSDLSRNIMPFYFAQEQALKRWARGGLKNPATFRRLQLLHQAGRETGVLQTDPTTGQETFTVPVGGVADGVLKALAPLGMNGAGALAISFSGSMTSLNTIAPEQESFSMRPAGPVVSIPALILQKLVPDSTPAVQALLNQTAQGGFWQQVVPNAFLRNVLKAGYGDNGNSFMNAEFDALRAMKYNGMIPNNEAMADPVSRQRFISQARNWTRIAMFLNAIVSSTGLASTHVVVQDAGIKQQFIDQITKSGDIRQAYLDFQKAHPNATPYTVFNTDSPLGVSDMPAGAAAQQFFQNNANLFKSYPYAASWLFPQIKGDKFSIAAYNEQAAFGLRQRKTADQFVQDLYSAAADQEYFSNYNAYQATLAQHQGDAYTTEAIKSQWSQWVQDFGNFHPVWYQSYNDPARVTNAQQAAQQLGVVLGFLPDKTGKTVLRAPESPQVEGMRQLYSQYEGFAITAAQLQANGQSTTGLKAQFTDYLDQVSTARPELQPVISRVFKVVAEQ